MSGGPTLSARPAQALDAITRAISVNSVDLVLDWLLDAVPRDDPNAAELPLLVVGVLLCSTAQSDRSRRERSYG
jgi:hypothetical protein